MDYKQELKIKKALSKIFKPVEPKDRFDFPDLEPKLNKIFFTDYANICAVMPKSKDGLRILLDFINKNDLEKIIKRPNLDFSLSDDDLKTLTDLIKSKYSMDYLLKILNVLKEDGASVEITLKSDYPIRLSSKNFAFILAPRIN